MNFAPILFLGLLLAMAGSWTGLVLSSYIQLGGQKAAPLDMPGQYYPAPRPGMASQGQDVYRSLGCAQCHSQSVRPQGFGNDYARGWGERRTVPRDYLGQHPVLTGSQRLGPDLANIAARPPQRFAAPWQFKSTNLVAQAKERSQFYLAQLYQPQINAPWSTMPPHPFLFEKRPVGRAPAPDALVLPAAFAPPAGYEIVPKPEAKMLAAYLLNLRMDTPLYEAPLPLDPTNLVRRAASLTNAMAPSASAPPATPPVKP